MEVERTLEPEVAGGERVASKEEKVAGGERVASKEEKVAGERGGGNGGQPGSGRGGRTGQASPVDPHGGGGGRKGGGLAGAGGGQSKTIKAPKSLRDIILSWSVDDILADENTVAMVPGFHGCTEDYITTYSNLLVQQCRANVKYSLQNIKSSIAYNIEAILPTKSELEKFIDIDLYLDANGNYHVAKEGDLFLFSEYSPQSEGFNYFHRSIGIATDISVHSKFHKGFKVYSLKRFGKFKYATFLTNVNDSLNAWNVMHLENTEKNCSGINSVTKLPKLPNPDCICCPRPAGLNRFISNDLSEEQKRIVISISEAVQCKESNIIKLVSGPQDLERL